MKAQTFVEASVEASVEAFVEAPIQAPFEGDVSCRSPATGLPRERSGTARSGPGLWRDLLDLTKARLDHKVSQYRVSQAEAAAKANRRAEAVERARLRQTSVMAPRSGQVLRVLAWPGEAVEAYEPVVQVVTLDPLFVIAHVPINDAARIKVRMQASLLLDGAARPLRCTVAVVDKVADGGSGLCRVKLTLPNPDRSIAAGASGTVTFELEP